MDAVRVFLYFILLRLCAEAQPVKDVEINTRCINITPERTEEIKKITEEINGFINKMADIYEDIDITFAEVHIENHSDQEKEEKETTLKILVHDCINNSHSKDSKNSDDHNEPEYNSTEDNDEYKSTDVKKYEHQFTDGDDDSNNENESDSNKTIDNESSTHENNDQNVADGKRESEESPKTSGETDESTPKVPEPNEDLLINEKSGNTKKLDDTDTKEVGNLLSRNVDSRPTITYNFNGKFDNSNLYISTPKDSPSEIERNYLQLYFELCQNVLGKRNKSIKNFDYASRLQELYENPGRAFFDYHSQDNYDNPNEIDDMWNVMINKLKRDDRNPKNCVYTLKKTCEYKH